MNTSQLYDSIQKDKFVKKTFCGIVPIDKLPLKRIKNKCSFIVNTDPASQPGTHWFAIFSPKYGPIEIFDSFGRIPEKKYLSNFLKINKRNFIYNRKIIQSNDSNNCGQFSLIYLLFRNRGYSMKKILKFFTEDKNYNDFFIENLYKKLNKKLFM